MCVRVPCRKERGPSFPTALISFQRLRAGRCSLKLADRIAPRAKARRFIGLLLIFVRGGRGASVGAPSKGGIE